MTNETTLKTKEDMTAYLHDAVYCSDMITLEYKGFPVLVCSSSGLSHTHVNIIDGYKCLIMALWSSRDDYVASVCFDTMIVKQFIVDMDIETIDDIEKEVDK